MLEVAEAGLMGEAHRRSGEVEEPAAAAGVLRHGDEEAAGAQDVEAGGVHGGHLGQVGAAPRVAEVGPTAGVVERRGVAHPAAGQPSRLVDGPGVAGVGRRRGDQVDGARHVGQALREPAGIAAPDLSEPPVLGVEDVIEVALGLRRPPFLKLDADAAPTQGGALDEGGADPAHGVDDEVGGGRAVVDDAPRQLRQHVAGVLGRPGKIAAGPLVLGRLLGTGPDVEGHRLGRVRVGCHGLPTAIGCADYLRMVAAASLGTGHVHNDALRSPACQRLVGSPPMGQTSRGGNDGAVPEVPEEEPGAGRRRGEGSLRRLRGATVADPGSDAGHERCTACRALIGLQRDCGQIRHARAGVALGRQRPWRAWKPLGP